MENQSRTITDGLARQMPKGSAWASGPEGVLIEDEAAGEGRIAVIYDHGDNPPEITIAQNDDAVQTVLADGVAVAVVACAYGPRITASDVLLVERFVRPSD